ncbi:MAG: DNA-formamidopyrimidine glycosylase [Chloroflexi bacterium]|nr:DNA-formamidopyrimidine glycosylase [Chloroflexota bacterium]
MPELPEVESIRRSLILGGLPGKCILDAAVFWRRTIQTPEVDLFLALIRGETIIDIDRRGKYIQFSLSGGLHLLTHMRMTGGLFLMSGSTPLHPHTRVIFHLDDGRDLRFVDQRKFGRLALVENPDQILASLGPEPLSPEFTVDQLANSLHKRSRAIKPLLLDQAIVAGLGNIYVDEVLYEARIHPLRPANNLEAKEMLALYTAIRRVLKSAVDQGGTTFDSFANATGQPGKFQEELVVFHQVGLPCPRCNTPILRLVVAQRGTHICPNCQVLAAPQTKGNGD